MIYLLEDDDSIRKLVIYALESQGFEAAGFAAPSAFWDAMRRRIPDLLLLDIMLPGMDGFEVCRRLRAEGNTVPILMLTAREGEQDKVLGLESGADDYITKPFSVKEMAARIKANIRRSASFRQPDGGEVYGPFLVDRDLQTVSRSGRQLELTQREYDIMCYFFAAGARVVTREELMEKVWGFEETGAGCRMVDTAVTRLREKVERPDAEEKFIRSKRGVGYYYHEG
jgi:two-component system response regulator VicR